MKNVNRKLMTSKKWARIGALIILDAFVAIGVSFLSLLVRYDFYFTDIPTRFFEAAHSIYVINMLATLVIFWMWRLYKSVWRYASATELINIGGATASDIRGLIEFIQDSVYVNYQTVFSDFWTRITLP